MRPEAPEATALARDWLYARTMRRLDASMPSRLSAQQVISFSEPSAAPDPVEMAWRRFVGDRQRMQRYPGKLEVDEIAYALDRPDFDLRGEARAQHFMTLHNVAEGLFQGSGMKLSLQAEHSRQVVVGTALQLVNEPKPLLREGKGQGTVVLHSSNGGQHRAVGLLELCCEPGYGGMGKDLADGQLYLAGFQVWGTRSRGIRTLACRTSAPWRSRAPRSVTAARR